GDWISETQNWVFLLLALTMLFTAFRVVTSKNVVHAVLYLVVTLVITAAFFLLLGAEFIAWVVVLISIGAVVVLFLFGIMITKGPMGEAVDLSHPTSVKIAAGVISFLLFVFVGGAVLAAFPDTPFPDPSVTRTTDIGESMFQRWVIPFEVVSVLLLAALIGGIVLARKDPPEVEAAMAADEGAPASPPPQDDDDHSAAREAVAQARAAKSGGARPDSAGSDSVGTDDAGSDSAESAGAPAGGGA
ncbi:MAG: NADH-quinone oxidoreductase subunit J family protein, partial [Acidimicrobiia bacterium]